MLFRRSPSLAAQPDAKFMSDLRQDLLRRYAHRRSQKLSGKEPVNLRKIPSDIGAAVGETMTLTPQKVPQAMLDLFNEANGRLLLTGVPGAGKTTLLLQLAETLLERDIKLIEQKKIDFEPPLVVLLNLASWRSTFKNLDAWLAEILHLELSTNRIVADRIRQNVPLILLLDGLDEVVERERPSCLAAIGEYGSSTHRFAVSCRKEELKALEQHIPLNIFRRFKSPIEVAELSEEQVKMQICSWSSTISEAEGLRRVMELKQDETLLQAMRTPFYFNLAQRLFSSGKHWEQFGFSKTEDIQVREKELLERFIENALKDGWRTQTLWAKHYHSPAEVRHWLAFLASRMNQKGLVVFELGDLQYNWCNCTKMELSNAITLMMVVHEFVYIGIPLVVFTIIEQGVSLLTFVVIGLILSTRIEKFKSYEDVNFIPKIETKDNVRWWSLRAHLSLFKKGRVYVIGCCVGVLFSLMILIHEPLITKQLVFVWLVVGLLWGFAFSFLAEIFMHLALVLTKNYPNLLHIDTPYQRFFASAKNLHFSILQHWHLLRVLRRRKLLPSDLVKFLNDMADRHLLEWEGELKRDKKGQIIPNQKANGATWRFRHRMVQDYFAEKWKGE